MARKRSSLPQCLCPHRVSLVVRNTTRSVTADVLHSGCVSANEREGFVSLVEESRQNQWSTALYALAKPAHDRRWIYSWLWSEMVRKHPTEQIECIVVKSGRHIQGIMILGQSEAVNLAPKNQRLLYLAYISTAPWNRPPYSKPTSSDPDPLKGVGTALIEQAVCMSQQLGHGGRLGLRAMGGSAKFYEKIGMTRVRKGVKYKEFRRDPWFEFSDKGVKEFLSRRTR